MIKEIFLYEGKLDQLDNSLLYSVCLQKEIFQGGNFKLGIGIVFKFEKSLHRKCF